jgi:hypothetical protein
MAIEKLLSIILAILCIGAFATFISGGEAELKGTSGQFQENGNDIGATKLW